MCLIDLITHKLEANSIQLGFDNKKILSNIYIKCETGKITGLLGRNGQGKSCLMQIIYGTLKSEKSILIDNVSYSEAYKRSDLLKYLPQFNFILKSLSSKRVFQDFNINFEDFIERFPEYEESYKSTIASLSGGGQRLIELFALIKSTTKFVMLDEPFTHLSPLQVEKVKNLLLKEKANKGILITDHMHEQVLDICDNVYVLSNGQTHLTTSSTDIETLGYARR